MAILLNTDELKSEIEQHFEICGLSAELQQIASAKTTSKTQYVRFKGTFNGLRKLTFEVHLNGQHEPILKEFSCVCPISEMIQILDELRNVISSLQE